MKHRPESDSISESKTSNNINVEKATVTFRFAAIGGLLLLIADPSFTRARANILETVREWLGMRRSVMAAERLRE